MDRGRFNADCFQSAFRLLKKKSHRLRNHAITNWRKRRDFIQRGGVAQAIAGKEIAELVLLIMQRHVIEDHSFHQRVDVVGSADTGTGFHVAAGAHMAQLLVHALHIADGGRVGG